MSDHHRILASLPDYEQAALALLDDARAAYLTGGAGDELTVARNRQAFDRVSLVPRVLAGNRKVSLSVDLPGARLDHPVILAPVAYLGLAHSDAEPGTAAAATAQDTLMVLSCQSGTDMEQVRQTGRNCQWFQLYLQPLREATLALVRRAEAAGFTALVVTVDAPVSGARSREMREGFHLPDGIEAVILKDLPQPVHAPLPPGGSVVFDRFMAEAPSWEDIRWLREQTRLKIILKGILSPEDAKLAVQVGVDAVVVSNHGGRVLDSSVPTLRQLPRVVAAVNGAMPVLVDGGIRRGTDVVKALALGAAAVMVGRPVVHALTVGGARGVAHMLRILRDETEVALALCGCDDVTRISSDLLDYQETRGAPE